MSEPATPALSRAFVVRRVPAAIWLLVISALLLVGFSAMQADAAVELALLVVLIGTLASGHLLMRSRARRLAAEEETARLKAEAELQAKVGECEQRRKDLAAFAQLAAHVAHEVRNPLNAIMLNAELLEDEVERCHCEGAGEAAGLVATIQQEAARLQRLTDEYLAFARPPRPARGNHSLNVIVEDLVHLVREEAARQGVVIETRMARDCPCAVFDPHQLKQAALNLVRNALQAMPDGGRLALSTETRPDRFVVLHVDDTGCGIPEEARGRIFDPFFTTKPSGTGLGLPLAAHILREHDGFIDVESRAEGGTRFTLRLPALSAGDGPCSCSALPAVDHSPDHLPVVT